MARRIPLSTIAKAGLVHGYRNLATDFGAPIRKLSLRPGKSSGFQDIRPKHFSGDRTHGQALLKGHFSHARQSLDVGQQGDPWTVAAPSERFAIWLHRFDWLGDILALDDKTARVRARFLIDQWINIYGQWNRFAWEPDLLTHRLYNWLQYWSPALQVDNLSDLAQLRRQATLRQLKRLRSVYKRTSPGLVRFKAAAVLAMAGTRITDGSDAFLARGLDWLDDCIDEQILPDGGHISRNPEVTFEALIILLTLDDMLQQRGVEGSRAISRAIDRLLPIIPFFLHADGSLATFNGASEGPKAMIKALLKAKKQNSKSFGYTPHTQFQRIEQNGTVLITDTGGSPRRPFDRHAHLAPLAFELSTPDGQIITNCGWSGEQPLHWRRPMRATAAHSTLILNDRSAGQLLKDGRRTQWLGDAIARDAGPSKAARKEQESGIWLEATHDGYRTETGLLHRRRLYMNESGHDIRGEDSLVLPLGDTPLRRDDIPFQIRFHLHPDIQVTLAQNLKSALLIQKGKVGWRFRTDGGPLFLEPSYYLGTGLRPQKTEQLVIAGRAFCDSDGETRSNRVRWSFRRLDEAA